MPASLASKAHFDNYSPSTFGGWKFETIPELVPLEFDGVNFGQCAKAAHGLFSAFLTELIPHIPGGLKAGKCWGFSATDDLPDGSWSFHHYGLAIDVNWNANPMGTYATNPDAGQTYAIPRAVASEIAHKYGMEYGGDWSGGDGQTGFKDYMHFEIHLSEADASAVTAPLEDDMSAADVVAINHHTDQQTAKILEAVKGVDKDLASALAGIYQKFGLEFRGDGTHPDSLAALHAEIDAIKAKVGA